MFPPPNKSTANWVLMLGADGIWEGKNAFPVWVKEKEIVHTSFCHSRFISSCVSSLRYRRIPLKS